jgi:multidrug efflux system membrane fusion protein
MKTRIVLLIAALIVVAALIFGYVQMSQERKAEAAGEQPVAAKSKVERDTNGETVVSLDLKAQQLIQLQTASLAATNAPMEIKAYGRVLDSVALVARENEAVAARATSQASQREYERLKKLNALDNASARALEAAEAEMKRSQSAADTAGAQLVAASGKAIAEEPREFFQSLAGQETILARLDLPASESAPENPIGARIEFGNQKQFTTARFLGRAATTDPQVQGEGFLFMATNAPAALTPGLAVVGFLQLPGESQRGVIVPDDAVVRSDEQAWIYAQTSETNFVRREIILNHPTGGGWFVTNGVAPGERVVVTGAQALLSEEHKAQIKIQD